MTLFQIHNLNNPGDIVVVVAQNIGWLFVQGSPFYGACHLSDMTLNVSRDGLLTDEI